MSDPNGSNQPGSSEDRAINTNRSDADFDLEAQQVPMLRDMQERIRSLQNRMVAGDAVLAERVFEMFNSLESIAPWGPEGSTTAPTEADIDADGPSADLPSGFFIASMDAISRLYDPRNPLTFDILTTMGNPIQQTLYTGVLSLASFVISRTADRARAKIVQCVLERELNARSAAQSSIDTNAERASNDTYEANRGRSA